MLQLQLTWMLFLPALGSPGELSAARCLQTPGDTAGLSSGLSHCHPQPCRDTGTALPWAPPGLGDIGPASPARRGCGVSREGWTGTLPYTFQRDEDTGVTSRCCTPGQPSPASKCFPGAFQLGSAAWSCPGGHQGGVGTQQVALARCWCEARAAAGPLGATGSHWERGISRAQEGNGGAGWAPTPRSCQRHIIPASFLGTAMCFISRCLGRINRLKGAAKFGCWSRVGAFPVRPV